MLHEDNTDKEPIMTTDVWYNDIAVLWKQPFDFFPVRRPDQSDADFVNSLVRFILYTTVLLSIYKRKGVVLVYGSILIVLVSVLFQHKTQRVIEYKKNNPLVFCRKPSLNNPYANTLTDEYGKGEWTPCDGMESIKDSLARINTVHDLDDYPNSEITERQFMTLPNAGYGPDFAGFSKELARGSGILDY